jgi:hypothetical protein
MISQAHHHHPLAPVSPAAPTPAHQAPPAQCPTIATTANAHVSDMALLAQAIVSSWTVEVLAVVIVTTLRHAALPTMSKTPSHPEETALLYDDE